MIKYRKSPRMTPKTRGQALVEYALILTLLAISFGIALAATGPAIGNVFNNVIYNIVGSDPRLATDISSIGGASADFWQTVTWVAQFPQGETPYPTAVPLPGTLAPTAVQTNTYTHTSTFTPTFTHTPTYTPTSTFTPGPSPTPSDKVFNVPFVNQGPNNTTTALINDWRLDNSLVLSTAPWAGEYYENTSWTGTPILANVPIIDFNFGSSPPLPASTGWNQSITANWSAIWTQTVNLSAPITVRFTGTVDDTIEVRVGAATVGSRTCCGTFSWTYTIPAGVQTISVRYRAYGAPNNVQLAIERVSPNPDDQLASSTVACAWGRRNQTNDSNSPSDTWTDNTASSSMTAGRTCYLELRGYVDLTGVSSPQFSFWDIWDLTGSASVSASLEVADYITDVNGFFDRANAVWRSIPLRSGGTANYNWTRTQIDLTSFLPSLSDHVTFRFRITNSGGSTATPVRWYIDDIQVTEESAISSYFTVGNNWDLNTRTQMDDFVFNADSNRTLQLDGQTPGTWRWDITSTRARTGTAWEDSASGANYPTAHSEAGTTITDNRRRYNFLEFRYPLNLSSAVAPPADDDGDTGDPLLTFWSSWQLNAGTSIQVQYTFEPRLRGQANAGASDNWQVVPDDGMLVNYTNGVCATSPCGRNETTNRNQATFIPISIRLANIPGYDSGNLRIRFALITNPTATANQGWWIDDIRIERDNLSLFASYPFVDSAENADFTSRNWQAIGDWARTDSQGGMFNSSNSYTDSPLGNYAANSTSTYEMRRTIDLLYDTPENTGAAGEGVVRPPASRPFLTFYHKRFTASSTIFYVDLWSAATNNWVSIWSYTDNTSNRTNRSWERVEIDLREGLVRNMRVSTGNNTWVWQTGSPNPTSISNNTNLVDDDIRIRFRLVSSSSTADGIYIDEIRIQENPEVVHRLWGAVPSGSLVTGPGDGPLADTIETASPNLPAQWFDRWYRSGNWDEVNQFPATGYTRSGNSALHDSPQPDVSSPQSYEHSSFLPIEYRPIIDMRGTAVADRPMLTFWARYNIGGGDTLRVQVAEETTDAISTSATNPTQIYNDMYNWSAWSNRNYIIHNTTVANVSGSTIDTWGIGRVDLSSFAGKRIRIRFLLETNSDGSVGDGLYLDDIAITFGPLPTIPYPIADNAESMARWIPEGTWGTTSQYYFGSGSTAPNFGVSQWQGFYFDCETLGYSSSNCTSTSAGPGTYTNLLNTYNPNYADSTFPAGIIKDPPRSDIEMFLTNSDTAAAGRPPGTPNSSYNNSFAARWRRTVQLEPGTYRISTISDDGIRLSINDVAGTNVPGTPGSPGFLINNWTGHSATADYFTLVVSSFITRTLTLEYFELTGSAVVALYIAQDAGSFSDSPNIESGGTWTTVNSELRNHSSIYSNGVFDFSGNSAPFLLYHQLYALNNGNRTRVQISTNGGMSWTTLSGTALHNTIRMLPSNSWQEVVVPLTGYTTQNYAGSNIPCCANTPNVMIRFNYYTDSTSPSTNDGWYVTNIRVQ